MTKHSWPVFLLMGLLLLTAILFLESVRGQGWISGHVGKFGGCCGEDDCFKVNARWIEDRGETAVVEVNGIQMVVDKDIIKASQDQSDYWCHLGTTMVDDETGGGVDDPLLECATGKISQECAHCIFIAVGT